MDFLWSRQIGRARVSVICEATGWWPLERGLAGVPEAEWRPLVEADAQGRKFFSFNLVHVQLPGASLLLDTGFGDLDVAAPDQALVPLHGIRTTGGLTAGLAALGQRPEDITHVLLSHLHVDHLPGATKVVDGRRVPAFPNARYYVMADEWRLAATWHQPLAYVPEVAEPQQAALAAAGVVDIVEGEREVAPGVTFVPAPGESPGHAVVRVDTGAEIVYYLGDLFHQPVELQHLDWMPRFKNHEMNVATRRRLLPRLVAERALLILAHEPLPAIGRAEPAGDAYRWVPVEG